MKEQIGLHLQISTIFGFQMFNLSLVESILCPRQSFGKMGEVSCILFVSQRAHQRGQKDPIA